MQPPNDTPERTSISIERLDTPAGWLKLLPEMWGPGVDLFCFGPSLAAERVAATFAAVIRDFRPHEGFPACVILLFPPSPSGETGEAMQARIRTSAEALTSGPHPIPVEIRILDDCRAEYLVDVLKKLPERSCIFVADAARFVWSGVASETPSLGAVETFPGWSSQPRIAEELWLPHISQTVSRTAEFARERTQLIAIWSGQHGPVRPEHREKLLALDSGIWTSTPSKGDELFVANAAHWIALARAGRMDELATDLDRHELAPAQKALVEAQALQGAGKGLLGFERLRPFRNEFLASTDPHLLLLLAELALMSLEQAEARAFLEAAVKQGLPDKAALTNATRLAGKLELPEVERAVAEAAQRIDPHSDLALRSKLDAWLSEARFSEVVLTLEAVDEQHRSPWARYTLALARTFSKEPPPYEDFIRQAKALSANSGLQAILDCARDALRRNKPLIALALLLDRSPPPAPYLPATVDVVMDVVERLWISRYYDHPKREREVAQHVLWLVRQIGSLPWESRLRIRLTRLLSPEVAGNLGLATLIKLLLEQPTVTTATFPAVEPSGLTPEEFRQLLDQLRERLSQNPHLRGAKLLDGISMPVPVLLGRMTRALEQAIQGGVSTEVINEVIQLGLAVAHDTPLISEDLQLVRIGCAGLLLADDPQPARDYAEHCLTLLARDAPPARRRVAWNVFADIYDRATNPFEALVALACARLQPGDDLSYEDAFSELLLLARVFRDLHFVPLALQAAETARQFVIRLHPSDTNALFMLDVEAAKFRFMITSSRGQRPADTSGAMDVTAQARKVAELNRQARDLHAMLAPTLTLLAQLMEACRAEGKPVPEEARREFEESLPLAEELSPSFLRELAGEPDLRVSLPTPERTRYAEDFAKDIDRTRMLARKRLLPALREGALAELAHNLEWLTDHAVRHVDHAEQAGGTEEELLREMLPWAAARIGDGSTAEEVQHLVRLAERLKRTTGTSAQPRLPETPAHTARMLSELSRDMDIHLLALDTGRHRLLGISSSEGTLVPRVERSRDFDPGQYLRWRQRHPHSYGMKEHYPPDDMDGSEKVRASMKGLGLSSLGTRTSVLILDTRLQPLPANLLLVDGHLAGVPRPIATSPSLSWLHAARTHRREPTHRRVAWIPEDSSKPEEKQVLRKMARMLGPTLLQAGFDVSLAQEPPEHIRNADIAVIGVHGGLNSSGPFFQRVATEQEKRMTARALARCVEGAGLVVLLVCNAGRLDTHPFSNSTVGLPSLLLDYGVRTVVASPWALRARCQELWLRIFLRSLDQGMSAAEANHHANRALAIAWPHPVISLAMHVMGDPLFPAERVAPEPVLLKEESPSSSCAQP